MNTHDYPQVPRSMSAGSATKPRFKNTAEKLPALVQDPFDAHALLDLATADMPNFNLVDGTVALATDGSMPFVLFKGFNRDTWFYAPRWGRIAKNPDGEPAFTITKKVRNNPDGSKTTIGGVLSFLVELVVELPGDDQRQKWTQLIRTLYGLQPTAGRFSFQPLRLTKGKMNVYGLDMYARPGQPLKDVDVGASSSIGFAVELTPDGADHFAAMVGASPSPFPPQVAIQFAFKYQFMIPQCDIQAFGSKKKTYDYFSVNAKARASYFGLVNGSAEYQSTRADLRQMQALDVRVIGAPPQGVDLQKLLDAVYDMFIKMEVGQWIQPDPKPVEAPAPGGFFGGVSVAMKSVSLSDEAQFSEHMSFASISEEIHLVSFNFEQQVGQFDPKKHVFIEQDDIKLPFKLAIGSSEKVKIVVPSASYTTATGPQSVQCATVDGKQGGLAEGIIQFTWPQKPTSAQISLIINFVPPFGPGYEFRSTQPVSDTGAAFLFEPDQFVQRTRLFFVFAALAQDLTSKALFKWEWTPPTDPNGIPRPKISGFFLVAPDQNGAANNLPTYDIEFPYHPGDWTGEATPKIQYKVQGLTGDWKTKTAAGEIGIGETSLAFDWSGSTSIGDSLAIPSMLLRHGLPDPKRQARLASQFGRYMTGPRGQGATSSQMPGASRRFTLGYVPAPEEPTLFERELIARASLGQHALRNAAIAAEFDLRNVDGENFVTAVQDQSFCGACVAFGVCAAAEATQQVTRGNPNLGVKFSEAHLFYCLGGRNGRTCGNTIGDPPAQEPNGGWWAGGALAEFQNTGVVDEDFYAYRSPGSPFEPTLGCEVPDGWEDHVTKIDSWTVLSVVDQMKSWISGGQGALVAAFTVYQDFMTFFQNNSDDSAVYRRSATPGNMVGGHCICVVGYSDSEQCWICKNSWSTGWAANGFFKIGYGEVGIDAYMWGVAIS